MSNDATYFLNAVVESKGPTPALIFADWLDENGYQQSGEILRKFAPLWFESQKCRRRDWLGMNCLKRNFILTNKNQDTVLQTVFYAGCICRMLRFGYKKQVIQCLSKLLINKGKTPKDKPFSYVFENRKNKLLAMKISDGCVRLRESLVNRNFGPISNLDYFNYWVNQSKFEHRWQNIWASICMREINY